MRKISKRVSVVFLTLVMMFVMTACGETGNNGQDGNNDQKPAASQTDGVTNAVSTSADKENAEVVTLQLSLESDKNLAFSKYDMNVYFDGKSLSTLKNGEKYSTTLTVSKGSHELKLCKADDESLKGVETITLDGSKAISYFVKHDRNSIDISRTETKDIDDEIGKNETTAQAAETLTTEKAADLPSAIEPATDVPTTEELTTEEKTEEHTTQGETIPATEPKTTQAAVPKGHSNALRSAKSYLSLTGFSAQGLVDQLLFEEYSQEEAEYAVNNCGADWNEQAIKSAKSYLKLTAFSRQGLIDQLVFDKFTADQAVYGVDNCNADWNEQAAKSAKSYLDLLAFSRKELIDQIIFDGFTQEQAEYGVSQNGY